MALKEKALRRLGEKLALSAIPFAAGGEWLLCQRGLSNVYHSFDIVVAEEDADRADRVLTKLGMRQMQKSPEGIFCCHYHFDGADITLLAVCGEAVVTDGEATVLGVTIPLLQSDAWGRISQKIHGGVL